MRIVFQQKLFCIISFLLMVYNGNAQNCLSPLNGTVVNFTCNQACSTVVFQIPHLKSSSDYSLISIPYNPYPFVTSTGLTDPTLYQDDNYSNVINLPFTFCFYDSMFTNAVVGSNGLMTFEQAVGGCDNSYPINNPIPFAGTFNCNSAFSAYYPRSSIMAAFSDLDPRTSPTASPSDRKIQWEVLGTAPCRVFVVSYYHIGVFGVNANNCAAPWNTFQMVLHESTGLIKIFFEQKLCASSTNAGRGVFGIQNWNRTKWVSDPAKNNTFWTESNSGYAFTPSGGASRYISSQIMTLNGTVLGTADTATTSQGLLDLTFNNFCPAPGNGQYIIRTTFTSCDNPSLQLTNYDTITVNRINGLTATSTFTGTACVGANDGTITVTPTGTGPFIYSLDGGSGINAPGPYTFMNVSPGPHSISVTDANGCVYNLNVDIPAGPAIITTLTKTDALCNGSNTGSITVTQPTLGTPPYRYSLDSATWQTSNVFNNLPAGTYTVYYASANGCPGQSTITINEPSPLGAMATTTNASCNGGTDGTIVVNATGGSPGYQYSINGSTYQVSNQFNVMAGTYTIYVKDNNGCINSFTTIVDLTNDLTFTPQNDAIICEGKSTQLTINSNATQYNWSPSTGLSNTSIYNPVANPTQTTQYIVKATLGICAVEDTVLVNVNPAPIPNAGADGYICYGQVFQLNASGGTLYQWTPSTFLDNPNIPNPISTPTKDWTYTLTVLSDANGCASLTTDQVRIDVTPPIKVQTSPFDTVAHSNDKIQLVAVPSDTDVIDYTWTPSTGLNDPKLPNPIATAGAVGDVVTYKVITSTIAGCKGEGFVTIRVYKGPDIYVPTGFTPNGDGRNDRFTPFPVGIKSYHYFRVFNRWGQLVFSTTALHDGWDGKLGGRDQPAGTYVWMVQGVTKDDKVITKKGTITLIR